MSNEKEIVLIAGGAGYVGSHTTIELYNAGYNVVIIDNLCNSSIECVYKIREIIGYKVPFHNIDLLDKDSLYNLFNRYNFKYVILCAGLKAVGESCEKPLLYYRTNMLCAMNLIEVMASRKVYNIVFSSSATVYGNPKYLPMDEKHEAGKCTNPYGRTKFFIEEMLSDVAKSSTLWNVVILRYFNPIGAHSSGLIGEDPLGIPNNIMPFLSQVAVGRIPELKIFGNDYNTRDGTGVRDYIHVVDLAEGHVAAIKSMCNGRGCFYYNLGTGTGYSVLEIVDAMGKACGKQIPYSIVGRRVGDIDEFYADASLAEKELHWKASRSLREMCEDTWRWQSKNPHGFENDSISECNGINGHSSAMNGHSGAMNGHTFEMNGHFNGHVDGVNGHVQDEMNGHIEH